MSNDEMKQKSFYLKVVISFHFLFCFLMQIGVRESMAAVFRQSAGYVHGFFVILFKAMKFLLRFTNNLQHSVFCIFGLIIKTLQSWCV